MAAAHGTGWINVFQNVAHEGIGARGAFVCNTFMQHIPTIILVLGLVVVLKIVSEEIEDEFPQLLICESLKLLLMTLQTCLLN